MEEAVAAVLRLWPHVTTSLPVRRRGVALLQALHSASCVYTVCEPYCLIYNVVQGDLACVPTCAPVRGS